MYAQWKTCVSLSLAVHLGVFAWAGAARMPVVIDGGRLPSPGGVLMAELVSPPEPAPALPKTAPPLESPPRNAAEPPVQEEAEIVPAAKNAPAAESVPTTESAAAAEAAPPAKGIPGTRLNVDFGRVARLQQIVVKALDYQRNAPKGFEKMVRAALSRHPGIADGTAKVSFRNAPSGSVDVVILSDSPALKTALDRVGWETAPLPSRYRIPYSGVDVTISIAGERMSVGVKVL